jgi:glutathione S-transferase
MSASLTLYGTHTSGPVYKVALALSLLGQPYRFRYVDFDQRQQKSPKHLELNRYGEVPVLVVDGGPALSQSGAILEWLAEQSGRFGGSDRQEARQWLFWTADRLAIPVYRARAIARGKLAADPAVGAFLRKAAEAAFDLLETHLKGRSWLVGDQVSIADIDLYPVVALAPQADFDLARWPSVLAFKERFETLPGWGKQADLAPNHDRD